MSAAKALVGLAIPLLTALLVGFSTGSFDYEEIGMLVGALVTGVLVYAVPNTSANTNNVPGNRRGP